MAKTLKQLQPHKFSAGDTVKVVRAGRTEWCKVGDTHTIRICKHDHEDGPVYVVDDDKDDAWIRECNLELVERDRQKGGEWKRHRGGKCPVSENSVIDVKLDTGDTMKNEVASDWEWSHQDVHPRIMQYRIISQPQAEEVDVKDTTIGTLSYKVDVDTSAATQAIDDLAAKWDQIETPFKWRDEVTELNAYIEKYTRERDALIERLASEGFALIPAMHPVMGVAPLSLPFSEWRIGDLVTSKADYNKQFTKGKQYKLTRIYEQFGANRISIESDDNGADNGWIASNFEFHSRP